MAKTKAVRLVSKWDRPPVQRRSTLASGESEKAHDVEALGRALAGGIALDEPSFYEGARGLACDRPDGKERPSVPVARDDVERMSCDELRRTSRRQGPCSCAAVRANDHVPVVGHGVRSGQKIGLDASAQLETCSRALRVRRRSRGAYRKVRRCARDELEAPSGKLEDTLAEVAEEDGRARFESVYLQVLTQEVEAPLLRLDAHHVRVVDDTGDHQKDRSDAGSEVEDT